MSASSPWRVVARAAVRKASNDCDAHTENAAACVTVANTNAGARLTPSLRTTAEQPPASVSSCAPLE